jgi:hypothetical protein
VFPIVSLDGPHGRTLVRIHKIRNEREMFLFCPRSVNISSENESNYLYEWRKDEVKTIYDHS